MFKALLESIQYCVDESRVDFPTREFNEWDGCCKSSY